MTILSVFQEVTPVIGLAVPSAVMASMGREHVELAALANTMAKRIMRAHEWQALKTIATYTGNGTTEDFSFPADYDRMLKEARLWGANMFAPFLHVVSDDRWLGNDVQSFDSILNAWIIYGGQVHIKPAMAAAATAKHWYISNLVVSPVPAGTNKAAFTADSDVFRLNEELLKLGIVWQWKSNKGQPYAEHMENYEELKEKLIADDKGSRMITVGRVRMPAGVEYAFPGVIVP